MDLNAIIDYLLPPAEESDSDLSDFDFHAGIHRAASDHSGDSDVSDDVTPKGVKGILGSQTLAALWTDMAKTSLPSWITRAPSRVGSTKVGKLSADQWRVTCTIHLPITLIRLWAPQAKTSLAHRLLDNFLDLVYATRIVHSRTMTTQLAEEFRKYFHRYLVGLRDLFPEFSLTPYHHLCLHLPFFFEQFGPSHAWRCFAFERGNYVLQQIQTNGKFGKSDIYTQAAFH
ncbi:hypothetical protein SISNIDRAFT_415284 [Sistotremastrum niveocremeum HHB9708]|uniref:DUF4218 domain-containing protein n=1 Tax=Sistotremastrum niveocremeum HHB9708 TaxID=1314777 RepID=A0A164RHY6_9AGAM|nr:hypothetical protein SISNIDRAFT_415284 [Sistotremastrum niveocremeum HHB9708]